MVKGKFIVFEGADGSGKTTQVKLLANYLSNPPDGGPIKFSQISFPRYESPWGKMIKRYLAGEFGKNLSPYLASLLYAGDRFYAKGDIASLLTKCLVICDRYIGSNIAHQGSLIKNPKDREEFRKWIEDLEFTGNKIPKEDLVIFLSIPSKTSRNLMRSRKLDIQEADLKHQEEVLKVFENLAKSKSNWVKVDCTKGDILLSPNEIHQKVIDVLKSKKII